MLSGPFAGALILTGPTGSGKTPLGIALAERLGAEIISMDSMAVYRGMDIGTAKPSAAERRRVRARHRRARQTDSLRRRHRHVSQGAAPRPLSRTRPGARAAPSSGAGG